MQDFSGPTLVADSIYGIRFFRIDDIGRLMAVTNGYVYRPGNNKAGCTASANPFHYRDGSEKNHQVANKSCSCGFYAYHTEYAAKKSTMHGESHRYVVGVIEATGRVTVGSQGFRAEKATVKALVVPKKGEVKFYDRAALFMDEKDLDVDIGIGSVICFGASLIAFACSFFYWSWWETLLTGLALLISFCLFVICARASEVNLPQVIRGVWKRTVKLYPDVDIYDSMDKMIKNFNFTNHLALLGDPSSPDFWEQQI